MNINKLYILEHNGEIQYFGKEIDRNYAINLLRLRKHGEIKTYEMDMEMLTALLKVRKI